MRRSRWAAQLTYAPYGSGGFTFLEVLVALCVVLLALVPLIHLHAASIRMIGSGAQRAKATLLANDRLAEILAQETPDLDQSAGHVDDANDGTVYRWTAVVTEARPPELESVPLAGLRQVHVEVAWDDGRQEAVVALDTYVRVVGAGAPEILEEKDHEKSNQQTAPPSRSTL
jgi:type II secretion system protein I